MPSTNGHGPKRGILYARVSTDEQARSGYSLAQQLEALREYADREGYEVLEEIADPGQSGASLERPGMDHIRDLVAAGSASVVLAQDRDRFSREPAYTYLLRREFAEHGCELRSLNDRRDGSPEGELIQNLVTPEVAARLDPEEFYGVWWFNRRRTTTTQTAEAGENGRRYRKHVKIEARPREEWIAVPVVNSGIPREVVEMAREAIKDRPPSPPSAARVWELSRGVLYCGCCGARMNGEQDRPRADGPCYHYYRCNKRHQQGKDACPDARKVRAEPLEEQVWALVSDVLLNPERLENGLRRMVERERSVLRGNPEEEAKTWAKRLAEVEHKRSGFQDMAAERLITLEELRVKLNALEETRKVGRTELDVLASRSERVPAIERDAEAVIRDYAGLMPEALGELTPEDRHRVYKMLCLKVLVYPDGGGELSGVFGQGVSVGPSGITSGSS